jgi:uncharacterized protein (TIGR02186 family)
MALAGLAWLAPGAQAMTAKANHDDIRIGLTYHGTTVSVSGMTDPNVDLIMKITADDSLEKMMRKDRKAGMWMNVEELTLDHVPEVYYLRSTRNLEDILGADQLNQYDLGYQALMERIDLKPAKSPEQKQALLGDFIKYKEDGKLYGESVGSVDVQKDENGESYFTIFDWPYQAPPGQYQVTVYAVKDGKVADTAESQVIVEQEGVVKSLSDLAQDNGGLYGAAAIGISLTAGFGVGIVFKGGGGSH